MTSDGWARRDVILGMAAAALALALPVMAPRGAASAGGDPPAPRNREARRRWALARMDEMAKERVRCHDRFTTPREVRNCQTESERRFHAYNEIYIEAARD